MSSVLHMRHTSNTILWQNHATERNSNATMHTNGCASQSTTILGSVNAILLHFCPDQLRGCLAWACYSRRLWSLLKRIMNIQIWRRCPSFWTSFTIVSKVLNRVLKSLKARSNFGPFVRGSCTKKAKLLYADSLCITLLPPDELCILVC